MCFLLPPRGLCWPLLGFLPPWLLITAGPLGWSLVTLPTASPQSRTLVFSHLHPRHRSRRDLSIYSSSRCGAGAGDPTARRGSCCSVTCVHLIGSFCSASHIFFSVGYSPSNIYILFFFRAWIKRSSLRHGVHFFHASLPVIFGCVPVPGSPLNNTQGVLRGPLLAPRRSAGRLLVSPSCLSLSVLLRNSLSPGLHMLE